MKPPPKRDQRKPPTTKPAVAPTTLVRMPRITGGYTELRLPKITKGKAS